MCTTMAKNLHEEKLYFIILATAHRTGESLIKLNIKSD